MPSEITDLINPIRLRLAIKRAFTGEVVELLAELFQNSQRAGARHVWITTNEQGFSYQDNGCGLRDEADFEILIKLGESGWNERIELEQQPLGLGIHCLLAHEEVESVAFASNLLTLSLDANLWWTDESYFRGYKANLRKADVAIPGMKIDVRCSKALTNEVIDALTVDRRIACSPALGYYDLLRITLDGLAVKTNIPGAALPEVRFIETVYQDNRLVIGLHNKRGESTQNGLWINWYGQMIAVKLLSHFSAYLEVRRGRPVNPMAPSRRGVIKDQALQDLQVFIRDALMSYFTRSAAEEITPLALSCFYDDFREHAKRLPYFVAAQLQPYESGRPFNEMAPTSKLEVFCYEHQPLLLADGVCLLDEDESIYSEEYGLHTFLELTGAAYEVRDADESRLKICHLWWKPGKQIALPTGYFSIFNEAGEWGLGTKQNPPDEWHEVGDRTVFTFNDPDNWDVNDVDFTVGGGDPLEFYRLDAWAGFDSVHDDSSYEELHESYEVSCDREICKIIGNAIPEEFSWYHLLKFVKDDRRIIGITPEYKTDRSRTPDAITLLLSDDEKIRLKLI